MCVLSFKVCFRSHLRTDVGCPPYAVPGIKGFSTFFCRQDVYCYLEPILDIYVLRIYIYIGDYRNGLEMMFLGTLWVLELGLGVMARVRSRVTVRVRLSGRQRSCRHSGYTRPRV